VRFEERCIKFISCYEAMIVLSIFDNKLKGFLHVFRQFEIPFIAVSTCKVNQA